MRLQCRDATRHDSDGARNDWIPPNDSRGTPTPVSVNQLFLTLMIISSASQSFLTGSAVFELEMVDPAPAITGLRSLSPSPSPTMKEIGRTAV